MTLNKLLPSMLDSSINLGRRGQARVATTSNIAIATALNPGDAIDGVTLAAGDVVLVPYQAAAAENGVYVVDAAPYRSPEFDAYNEHPGSVVTVQEGVSNADTVWLCTSNAGGTLGTTAISFSIFGVGSVFAGFSAYKAADQTGIATVTWTKVTFPTEEYDQGSYYDAANSKFTPPAGYYRVSAGVIFTAGVVDQADMRFAVYKNGTAAKFAYAPAASGSGAQGAVIAVDMQLNGTDYMEIFAYAGGPGTKTIGGGQAFTYFQAHRIG